MVPLTPAAQSGSGNAAAGLVQRMYRVQHIEHSDAMFLAHQTCLAEFDNDRCKYQQQTKSWFAYTAPAAMHAKIAAILASADVPAPSLDLRVVLLLAGPQASPPPSLPLAETQALADVGKILPYKGYQLLESGLVCTRDRATLRLGHDPAYEAQIELDRPADPRLTTIQVRRFELVRHLVRQVRREAVAEGGIPGAEWIKEAEQIMATRFAMEVGETVVVGTSKLNGDDRALIVLLTAGR
jgi:hypothetical protein